MQQGLRHMLGIYEFSFHSRNILTSIFTFAPWNFYIGYQVILKNNFLTEILEAVFTDDTVSYPQAVTGKLASYSTAKEKGVQDTFSPQAAFLVAISYC